MLGLKNGGLPRLMRSGGRLFSNSSYSSRICSPPIFVPLASRTNYSNSNGDRGNRGHNSRQFPRYFSSSMFLAGLILLQQGSENISHSDNGKASTTSLPTYRRKDVQTHTSKENGGIWITYKDGVYDVTEFVANHPGGKEKLMMAAGKDLSELWNLPAFRLHYKSPLAKELLDGMKIGSLHPDDVVQDTHEDVASGGKCEIQYSDKVIYDTIVIGSGMSGLTCASTLVKEYGMDKKDILVLEAQGYVGGRVKQVNEFIKGLNIDVGADFLHGSEELQKIASDEGEPLDPICAWAQGDGGPSVNPHSKGFGLYYLGKEQRLLRMDAQDKGFIKLNQLLESLSDLDENDFKESDSMYDYIVSQGLDEELVQMELAGFSNTLCSTSKDLSLKQVIRWMKGWLIEEDQSGGDTVFRNSFKVAIDHLKKGIQIELDAPVTDIIYSPDSSEFDLIKLRAGNGHTYYCKSLVVSSSPHVLKSGLMNFEPKLSPELEEALKTTNMRSAVKVILKFSERPWPKDLNGLIVADKSLLVPEIWFRDIADRVDPKEEPAKAYAVCFTTADFADKILSLPKDEVIKLVLSQMDTIFSKLEQQHMSLVKDADDQKVHTLPAPSSVYLGSMFWDWTPAHHPYIGGGYTSAMANTPTHLHDRLAEPYGNGNIFFAGEGSITPGATAHAALKSGKRAAGLVAQYLGNQNKK